jgi:hypothetical protein
MVTYFVSITDDKDMGWAALSDDRGKIFTYTRLWACDSQDSTPTYDQAEHFLRFLDKYVSRAIGSHLFLQQSKSNCSMTFLDRVTASDIAYTILVYENIKEVWEESGTSRKASVMTFRGNKPHVIKSPSIMKEGESNSRDMVMDG